MGTKNLKSCWARAAVALVLGAAFFTPSSRTVSPEDGRDALALYATPQTRQKLAAVLGGGYEKTLTGWAGRNVVVVAPQDIPPASTDDDEVASARAFLAALPGLLPAYPSLADPAADYLLEVLFERASAGRMSALQNDAMKEDRIGFIVLPGSADENGRAMMAALAGLPPGMLAADIPDPSGRGWLAMLLAHEAAHLRDNVSEPSGESVIDNAEVILAAENSADRQAIGHYGDLWARETGLDPGVPPAFEAARALGSLRVGGNFLGEPGSSLQDHATNLAFDARGGRMEAVDGFTPRDAFAAHLTVNTYACILLGAVEGPRNPDSSQWAKDTVEALYSSNPGIRMLVGMLASPSRYGALARQGGRGLGFTLLQGQWIGRENPPLHYAAVRALHRAGLFAPGTAEEIFAREFAEAFEKYVPEGAASPAAAAFLREAEGIDIRAAIVGAGRRPGFTEKFIADSRREILQAPAPAVR